MRDIWRQVLRIISSSERWNWLAFVSLLAGLGVLAFLVSPLERLPRFVQQSWEAEQFCEQPMESPTVGSDQFRVYASVDFVGRDLCMRLSQIDDLGRRYRDVRAEWSLSAEVLSRLLSRRHFHLLQLRPEAAQETGGPLSENYRRISYYPPYKVFLIALDAAPSLTPEYLEARKIGLLKDSKSRSGHRVPMRMFRDMGLDPQQLQLKEYPSHVELRRALERGDVDVISSYWNAEMQARFPDCHIKEIGGVEEGLNWFLAKNVFEDRKERCAVIDALDELTDESGRNPYFAKLSFTPDAEKGCDER